MRYIFQQNKQYYFRKKIPHTTYNFTFSLKTKNAKIALQKVTIFLNLTHEFFQTLKFEKQEVIMSQLDTVMQMLHKYKEEALREYSQLEEARHKDFTCTTKKGKVRDGGHPKCIKKWLKTIEEIIFGPQDNKLLSEFAERVLKRSGIDKSIVDELSEKDREIFNLLLLKKEAEILRTDYIRTKERFSTSKHFLQKTAVEEKPLQSLENRQMNRYYEKTILEIVNEFYEEKSKDTAEMHKYQEPMDIFLQIVADKKYLIDIDTEDLKKFTYTIKHMPPKISKKNKQLIEEYKNNLYDLAQYVDKNELETISLDTAGEKIRRVSIFLDYAVGIERLDKNRLESVAFKPTKAEKEKAKAEEKKERQPFTATELTKLFNESNWYSSKNIQKLYTKEKDKFYIPLIGLFSGMRLNEIAQLYLNDIQEENNIVYMRVDTINPLQKIKNDKSRRKVPIHSMLIELGFLDYIESLRQKGEERVFPQLYYTKKKGFGQAFSKKFMNKNFKKTWISANRLEDKKIMLDFHSFRHTFATRLVGRVEDSMIDFLMGHSRGSENKKRYIHAPLEELVKSIEKLNVEDIDFQHILEFISTIRS